MELGLEGRIALISGGSSGLGLAVARALAAEGAAIALNGRNDVRLRAVAQALAKETGRDVRPFAADVSAPSAAEGLVRSVVNSFGQLDILLCNTGGPPPGPFEEHSAEAWEAAIALNLLSTVHLCRAAIGGMRAKRWGRILCITSIAAKQPVKGLILSTTARAGVLGFAKSLADEVAADGVTVNVLCPGFIGTDRLVTLAADRAERTGSTPDKILAEQAATVPLGRIGRPAEFAAAAAFLASEPASYITGVALSVDGGLHRSIL